MGKGEAKEQTVLTYCTTVDGKRKSFLKNWDKKSRGTESHSQKLKVSGPHYQAPSDKLSCSEESSLVCPARSEKSQLHLMK
ncbi:unnamed protein product [Caretta caretta]